MAKSAASSLSRRRKPLWRRRRARGEAICVKQPFEHIEHTADYAILARGGNLRELIENAGRGMISLIVEADHLQPQRQILLTAAGDSPERLLLQCLRELLYLTEEGLIPVRFAVEDLDEMNLTAQGYAGVVSGEEASERLLGAIKAVTYHDLEIKSKPQGLEVQIVFDT